MAPKKTLKSSQSKPKSTQPKINLVKLDGATLKPQSSSAAVSKRRLDPLTAFRTSTPPAPTFKEGTPLSQGSDSGRYQPSSVKAKGKEKARYADTPVDSADDRMWVDIYEPTTEADLAVHIRKVEDVRRWLNEAFDGGPSGKLKTYRRILALTGPAGTGKTSTIRVLAREMDLEILEWRNAIGEVTPSYGRDPTSNTSTGHGSLYFDSNNYDEDFETLFTKFEAFLNRAANCQTVFTTSTTSTSSGSSQTSNVNSSSTRSRRRLILLEDLPNILHPKIQAQFHASLKALTESRPADPPIPVVIVISDAGLRGEVRDERMSGGGGWAKDKEQIVDVRTVLSRDLLHGPFVTNVVFNPIAPTLMRKALQALVDKHFSTASSSSGKAKPPSKDILNIIIESTNGDIRSAIMALQFACVIQLPGKKKKNADSGSSIVLEAVTRREQSLALFHLLGKVLYNKRKGDPPNASATVKDIQREKDIDAQLKDPSSLPSYLQHHERRTSRVDVDTLYADSPIDSSLFSLYIHQNYSQFCNDVDECSEIADCLSWVDSSGGEAWYQANPHQFHLLTLGTLHSLPSPVIRRSQKVYKPEFFDVLQKEKDAKDGLRLARDWVIDEDMRHDSSARRVGAWSSNDVVLELGAILRTKESEVNPLSRPPISHRLFSKMLFVRGDGATMSQLGEGATVGSFPELDEDSLDTYSNGLVHAEKAGGWLETDDIEDFD